MVWNFSDVMKYPPLWRFRTASQVLSVFSAIIAREKQHYVYDSATSTRLTTPRFPQYDEK